MSISLIETRIEPATPRDMLSFKFFTSPLRKKIRITFKSSVVDSKEDEEQTCSYVIGGGGGGEIDATTT